MRHARGFRWAAGPAGDWLRGTDLTPHHRGLLAGNGAELAWLREADGALLPLTPTDAQVPLAQLPSLNWQTAESWIRLRIESPRLGALQPRPAPMKTQSGGAPAPVGAMLVAIADLRRWADTAPASWIARLRFAASSIGHVMLMGPSLPPVPGTLFWDHEGVWLRAGQVPHPRAAGADIRDAVLGVDCASGDQVFLHDHSAEVLHERVWLDASRASIRATEDVIAREGDSLAKGPHE